MEKAKTIKTKEDAIKLLNIALEHEWAVSFEYTIHAYSMPKSKFFYEDPIMKHRTDARAWTIQIGLDEMYHALQLGLIITQMGGVPSFKTDEVVRYPRIMDNLKRDKMTEDMVTDLYQSAEFEEGAYPKIQNMILNISYDEVRHSEQFEAMMEAIRKEDAEDTLCFQPNPENVHKEEVQLLHEITGLENELMHRYLKYVLLFSEHQDLSQRLFKNSIDHMRHWDKNSGILIKMADVIQIENAEKDEDGVERRKRENSLPKANLRFMKRAFPRTDEKSSPIYFAQGLKGTLLICHGMMDLNVHFQDTVRLVQRLIELGKEDWEVAIYPVEGHSFRNSSSWADEYKRIFKLFEENLK